MAQSDRWSRRYRDGADLIAGLAGGGYEVAFQANTGNLWVTGTADLGMAASTSPSLAGLATGGYEAAFQANTTSLWVTGTAGTADLGLGMAAHTSPSIAARPGGGLDLVFQANTGSLWTDVTAGELPPTTQIRFAEELHHGLNDAQALTIRLDGVTSDSRR